MVRTSPLVNVFVLLVLLSSLAALAQSATAVAHESAKATRVRQLNNQILNLHAQMQTAGDEGTRKHLRGQTAQVLKARQAALIALMQESAGTALTFAFSSDALDQLTAIFPESEVLLEKHVAMMGGVEHWIGDYPNHKSQSLYLMRLGQQPLSLHFSGPEPNLAESEVLAVTGVVIGSDMAVESSTVVSSSKTSEVAPRKPNVSALSIIALGGVFLPFLGGTASIGRIRAIRKEWVLCALVLLLVVSSSKMGYAQLMSCSTKGAQKSAVLVITIPNGPLPAGVTVPGLEDVFFAKNTPGISMDGFIQEASYGQASASGDVLGPYNLTGTYSSCSDVGGAMLNDAVAAATASGVNLNNYNRLFLVFPDIWGCGWTGFAQVGACSLATTSGTFNLSLSEISAAYTTPRNAGVELVSHELGHNMGLLHSGRVLPALSTDVLGPLTSVGTLDDMNDFWSVMGSNVLGFYPGPQKAATLGWMAPTTNYQVVQSSGTFTLQPLETNPPGMQALKVQRGTGNSGWLWIEYRQPLGDYDSTLLPEPYSGALIHYSDSTTQANHSYLLNFTPSDTSWMSAALPAGQSWTDPYSNVSVSVVSASSAGLMVSVNYGAVPCTHTNPGTSITPLDPSTSPGIGVGFTLTVTNNDSSGCSSATFTPSSTQPSGWSSAFSMNSITLNPGQSGTMTMTQTPTTSAAPGTYAVTARAANQSYVGSATGNLTVLAAPAMTASLSASGTSYTRKSSVVLTASVINGSTPVAGASVVFSMTLANGTVVTQNSTTNRKGVASWNYRLSQQSPTGTYAAVAKAMLNSNSATTNTVQFTVH
jgi:M6 family metalloprotease-like protein